MWGFAIIVSLTCADANAIIERVQRNGDLTEQDKQEIVHEIREVSPKNCQQQI